MVAQGSESLCSGELGAQCLAFYDLTQKSQGHVHHTLSVEPVTKTLPDKGLGTDPTSHRDESQSIYSLSQNHHIFPQNKQEGARCQPSFSKSGEILSGVFLPFASLCFLNILQ